MITQLVNIRNDNYVVYFHNERTGQSKFTDENMQKRMATIGIKIIGNPGEGEASQHMYVKVTDPGFHEVFEKYSPREFDPTYFKWKYAYELAPDAVSPPHN